MKLKDIAKVQGGFAFKSDSFISNGTPVIRIGNIVNNEVIIDNEITAPISTIGERKEFLINKNDILIAMSGATVGKVGIYSYDYPSMLNQRVGNIKTDSKYQKYIYYLLQSPLFKKYVDLSAFGCAQPNISGTQIENFAFKENNLDEIEKIVLKLDNVVSLINLRKKEIEKCNELIKSQFVEMFGDPITNEKNWNTDKINNVAPSKNYKGEFDSNRVWLLNLDMVESNTGRIIDYLYKNIDNIGNSTCCFSEDNVLYSKLRPYLNKVVMPDQKGFATSEMVPLLPDKIKLNRTFLTYLLRSDSFVDYISVKVSGAKMPRVIMEEFRKYKIILPPIELQNKFAQIVKQIDKQKFEFEKSLKKLEELQSSLMQEYFG